MKKIYINTTKHAIIVDSVMLLPGSNVVEAIDERKNPIFKNMLEEGIVEETEDTASAVKKANTQDIANQLMKMGKDSEKTQNAGKKRIADLDKIDEEAKNTEAENKEKGED